MLLRNLDLNGEEALAPSWSDRFEASKKSAKRLKILKVPKSGIKPDWMVLKSCRCCRRTCVRWCRWMAAVSRLPT